MSGKPKELKITNVTTDATRRIFIFEDGTIVWFLFGNPNQTGPGVEPATSYETAANYIAAAYAYKLRAE